MSGLRTRDPSPVPGGEGPGCALRKNHSSGSSLRIARPRLREPICDESATGASALGDAPFGSISAASVARGCIARGTYSTTENGTV